MNQEPTTLYKLMVLYMLNCVNFPLTTAQIAEFILDRDYTNFLTLQTVFSDLTETGLAQSKTILNRTQLSLTDEGKNTHPRILYRPPAGASQRVLHPG